MISGAAWFFEAHHYPKGHFSLVTTYVYAPPPELSFWLSFKADVDEQAAEIRSQVDRQVRRD